MLLLFPLRVVFRSFKIKFSERERKNNYERAWEERVRKKRSRVGFKTRLCLAVSLEYGGAIDRIE